MGLGITEFEMGSKSWETSSEAGWRRVIRDGSLCTLANTDDVGARLLGGLSGMATARTGVLIVK